ncbi:unnamed protein product [Amoebophrya sp. A120]|nr:unnamed protein product [Amoebophrya sp. A120]|eukprot:GSA120T00001578001.1
MSCAVTLPRRCVAPSTAGAAAAAARLAPVGGRMQHGGSQSTRSGRVGNERVVASSSTRGLHSMSPVRRKLPVATLYDKLEGYGLNFYTGVPDSLLKDFCAYVSDTSQNHVIAANEGTAMATACGYHLATGSVPVVYLQNSGFGNIVNPLLSLVSPEVYKVPMLILIGWRGEPGVKDEPQHNVMGRLQEGLLDAVELPYSVLPEEPGPALDACLAKAVETCQAANSPYALLVRKNGFESYKLKSSPFPKELADKWSNPDSPACPVLKREDVLKILVPLMREWSVVSTTGVLSRELYEVREAAQEPVGSDFMCVGSMGHASAIAHGIAWGGGNTSAGAVKKQAKGVICLDGDGAALMHMGQLAINGTYRGETKLLHLLINNGLHESVGGQPTVGQNINFPEIAKGCGYQYAETATTEEEISSRVKEMQNLPSGQSSLFLEIRVKSGVKENLGRPKTSPEENKLAFVKKHYSMG